MTLGRGRADDEDDDGEETTAMLWLAGVNERLQLMTWMVGSNLVLSAALIILVLIR